jgi:hypothetical protein
VIVMTAREYVGPVRPQRGARWDRWCGTETDASRSPEWRDGFNHAMQTVALWLDFQVSALPREVASQLRRGPGVSSIGMLKSNLLGRLMQGAEIRRRPCPTHQGRLQMGAAAIGAKLDCCDATGWQRNTADGSGPATDELRDVHHLTHADVESWWRELPPNDAE